MLARLGRAEDLCIGLADANRHDSKAMSTVGLFLNMLPLHFKQPTDIPFDNILTETRAKVYKALGHAGVPSDELLQALRVPRSSSHSPLFQAFFDYHQGSQEKLKFADTAVILFTSGSTRTPKGIVLHHRNLNNHIEGYDRNWDIRREVVLQQSAFSFDLSIGQIFTALSLGGTLVVAPEETRRDPAALARLILKEGVTWTLLTPSEYSSVLQAGGHDLWQASSWKHALSCGEALGRKIVRDFAELGHETVRLYNAYGPAEAIISTTMAEIPFRQEPQDEGPVTIGRPNPNYSIYIVDEKDDLLPQGFPGEILIGGCGVALGYLNDEQLTQDKFLTSTFESAADREKGWNVTYRSGDMGRLLENGMVMYEGGREGDSQVKIRGFRIDLLDIESTLLNASNGVLSDATVTTRGETQMLVAHVNWQIMGIVRRIPLRTGTGS